MDDKVNPIVKEPFHVGSAAMSLLAIYAQSKGKFWEMNDILFNTDIKEGTLNAKTLLKEAGVGTGETMPNIYDPGIQVKLLTDIQYGMELGITGTPAYIIEGQLYLGHIPPNYIEKITK